MIILSTLSGCFNWIITYLHYFPQYRDEVKSHLTTYARSKTTSMALLQTENLSTASYYFENIILRTIITFKAGGWNINSEVNMNKITYSIAALLDLAPFRLNKRYKTFTTTPFPPIKSNFDKHSETIPLKLPQRNIIRRMNVWSC